MRFDNIKKLSIDEFVDFVCAQKPCEYCGIKEHGCKELLKARLTKPCYNGKQYYENVLAKPIDKFAEWLCLQQGGCNICQYKGLGCKEKIIKEFE